MKQQMKSFSIRLSVEQIAMLEQMAARDQVPVAQLIRQAIRELLKKCEIILDSK